MHLAAKDEMIRTKCLHKSYSFIHLEVTEKSFGGFCRHLAACTAIPAHINREILSTMHGPSPVATGTKELVIFRDAVSTVSAI